MTATIDTTIPNDLRPFTVAVPEADVEDRTSSGAR
jgi:hypothetical protein